ncbi:hypothetical protein RHMOL_Rhmol01G0301700 [Rhododendron molle]|uniref:Uncharacterized protein n=1 Tax=Rhododendron molle TaxID=49168 RepID=A0ACC0Q8I5_RHOML|nr:hypothetical protein RHMOL_Rhmol01G0301700 [Rhododendron molle]
MKAATEAMMTITMTITTTNEDDGNEEGNEEEAFPFACVGAEESTVSADGAFLMLSLAALLPLSPSYLFACSGFSPCLLSDDRALATGKSYPTVSEKSPPTVSEKCYPNLRDDFQKSVERTLVMGKSPPADIGKSYLTATDDYKKAVMKAMRKLRGFIAEENCAPLMFSFAWRSAGGAFGTMRHKAEQGHGASNLLEIAVSLLEPIKNQFPILSDADFYQLAGFVAVAVTGGLDVQFLPGRPTMPTVAIMLLTAVMLQSVFVEIKARALATGKSYPTVSEKSPPTVSEKCYPNLRDDFQKSVERTLVMGKSPPADIGKSYLTATDDYKKAVMKAMRKLRGFIAEENCAPLMFSFAWRSAGGAFGTMRHKAEQGHGASNLLEIAVSLLEPIKNQFPILSDADFYQLAGFVAVAVTGGLDVQFLPGRPVRKNITILCFLELYVKG